MRPSQNTWPLQKECHLVIFHTVIHMWSVCWLGQTTCLAAIGLLQVQALWAAFVHSTTAALHGARAAHSPCSPLPAPCYSCNTCGTAVPVCRALPLCHADTLQLLVHMGHAWGAAAEPSANSCSGEQCRTGYIGITRDFPLSEVFQLRFTS